MSTAIVPITDFFTLEALEGIQDNYSFHVRHFAKWIRDSGRMFNIDSVKDYFVNLNGSDLAAATKRVKRQAIKKRVRQLFMAAPIETQAMLDRELSNLDTGNTKAAKVNSLAVEQDKILSEVEVYKLIENARSQKQKLFMVFLYRTGCRISEAVNIKESHCKVDGGKVLIRIIGKGNVERTIKISVSDYEAIREHFSCNSDYLFCSSAGKPYTRHYISDQVAKLGRAVLNRSISAHTFRHSFATHQIHRTNKIKAVSRYLGHASVAITLEMYVHESLDDTELLDDDLGLSGLL